MAKASGGPTRGNMTPKQSHGNNNALQNTDTGSLYQNRVGAPNSAGEVNYGQKPWKAHPATVPSKSSPFGGNSAPA